MLFALAMFVGACVAEVGDAETVTKRGALQVLQDTTFAGVKLLSSQPFKDIGCQYRPADQQATGNGHFYNQCSLIAGGEWW